VRLFDHPLYTHGLAREARFPRNRYVRIRQGLEEAGAPVRWGIAPQCGRDHLLLAHDPAYVDAFLEERLPRDVVRRIGMRPWLPSIVPRTRAIVGGALSALDAALEEGIAGNLAGGTHHAHYDWGSGYCVFNDLAVVAHEALSRGVERLAVLDLDVHQGDGTATLFAQVPQVRTVSVHCATNFPFTKTLSDLDVPLPRGAGDAAYLHGVDVALADIEAFQPQLVLWQAGVDALAADRLGHLEVSREGMAERNHRVLSAVRGRLNVPLVVFMGGGYAKPLDPTVAAFVDLFQACAQAHGGGFR